MTFADIPTGAAVFLDANTFVYYFGAHPVFGRPCAELLQKIDNQDLEGLTSAHVLSEVAHRLMTVEAGGLFGWPHQGIGNRLRRHPQEVQQLVRYRQAIDEIRLLNLRILDVTGRLVSLAADVSHQTGLLLIPALIAQRHPDVNGLEIRAIFV